MSNTQLKSRIMRRVYLIYFVRKVLSPAFLRVYAIAGLIWYNASYVSFGSVFENTPAVAEMSLLYRFYSYAFMNTELVVQISIVAGALVASWLVWDGVRRVFSQTHTAAGFTGATR